MAYKQSPFNFGAGTGSSPLNKNGDPKKGKNTKSFTRKVEQKGYTKKVATRGEEKFEKKMEKLPRVEKRKFDDLPPVRAKKSPINMNGDPKKKAKHMKNKTAEEKAHNKHARKTEGSLVRQSLRRRFGSNKPK